MSGVVSRSLTSYLSSDMKKKVLEYIGYFVAAMVVIVGAFSLISVLYIVFDLKPY